MAPAEPSSQDYRVAASARAMAAEARSEIQKLESENAEAGEEGSEAEGIDGAQETGEPQSALSPAKEESETRPSVADNGLGSIEQRLIQSGAYSQLYPPGTIFSQQA